MSARTGRSVLRETAWIAICALGLLSMGGCEDPSTGLEEVSPEEMQLQTDVYPAVALAGENVWVVLRPYRMSDLSAPVRASISWDPASFEYVERRPYHAAAEVVIDRAAGWLAVQGEAMSFIPRGQMTFVFTATVDATTSSFTVHRDTHTLGR